MLTARRPFGGETVSEILAAVIKDEPALEALPAALPAAVAGVLRRCLVKDPAGGSTTSPTRACCSRTRGREPATPRAHAVRGRTPARGAGLAPRRRRHRRGGAARVEAARPQPAEPLTHFAVPLPSDQPMAFLDMPTLALSPDGRKLAFTVSGAAGQTMIHVRAFDQPEARPIPGTEGGSGPFFSPDGASLGFFADRRLKTVSLAGGPAQDVADAPTDEAALWATDGSILFVPAYDTGLWRVRAAGGRPQPVVSPESARASAPSAGPCSSPAAAPSSSRSAPSTARTTTTRRGSWPSPSRPASAASWWRAPTWRASCRPTPSSTLARGVLFAVRFDPRRLEVVGQPTPVLEGVAGDPSSGAAHFAVATDGTLAVVRGAGSKVNRLLTLVDRKGVAHEPPARRARLPPPALLPGRHAARLHRGQRGQRGRQRRRRLGLLALQREPQPADLRRQRLPRVDAARRPRRLHRAGTRRSSRSPPTAPGAEERLAAPGSDALMPGSWSADGAASWLSRVASAPDILLLTPGEEPRPFEEQASAPAFSPDGRWIAYASPAAGNANVFVRSAERRGQVAGLAGARQLPEVVGRRPRAVLPGHRQPAASLMAVDVASGPVFRAGPPRVVIPDTDPLPDVDGAAGRMGRRPVEGSRFVFVEVERAKDEGTRIDVALHWARHLAAR